MHAERGSTWGRKPRGSRKPEEGRARGRFRRHARQICARVQRGVRTRHGRRAPRAFRPQRGQPQHEHELPQRRPALLHFSTLFFDYLDNHHPQFVDRFVVHAKSDLTRGEPWWLKGAM